MPIQDHIQASILKNICNKGGDKVFGYIRPFKDELKIKDYRFYKSVYCSVCRTLGRKYGFLSRFLLSYDTAALAVFYISLSAHHCEVKNGRCCCNPLKKCSFCICEGNVIEEAAAANMLLAYYKLMDTKNDEGFIKRAAASILMMLFHRAYKKAARDYPDIDRLIHELMNNQESAENENASADKAADPSARFISALLGLHFPDNKPISVFGYYLGRWIYLIDAVDDLLNDVKHNSFNPFTAEYLNSPEGIGNYCECVINFTLSEMCKAYDLLEIKSYKELLDNIFYEGIYYQSKKCLQKLCNNIRAEEE